MADLFVLEIVRAVEKAGISLALVPPGGIGCTPAHKLTDDLRTLIRGHKPALIDWLAHRATPGNAAVHGGGDTLPSAPTEPPTDAGCWRELAQAYHAHHFRCGQCQAAGRGAGYGLRCGAGAALWMAYTDMHLIGHDRHHP